MIDISNLTYSYDGKVNVLDGASFTLKQGKVYCLLGINGAGKTTLFNCITGFLKSNISLNQKMVNEKILYVQDKMGFYENLTGREFVQLIFNLKGRELNKQLLEEVIERLQFKDKYNELISTYSLGTKQKLVLIIGFLLKYEYVFMDEPFSAIDFISAEVIMDVIRDYKNKNNTIVISTHLIDIAQEISDEILFLNNGKIYTIKNDFNDSKQLKKWIKSKI